MIGLMLGFTPFPALAQQKDEPVGWPYRPKSPDHAVPMPVTPDEAKKAAPKPRKDQPDPETQAADPGRSSSPAPAPSPAKAGDIAPLERFLLPVRPLDFRFEEDRIALNRSEADQLSRLAQRLRAAKDKIIITSRTGSISQDDDDRAQALEHALARALAVRAFLLREGVGIDRITLEAISDPARNKGTALQGAPIDQEAHVAIRVDDHQPPSRP
ncbi:OmpA family protein [Iodidimonas nitroreducens]|uniref:OmpA family protein n=1 Tax=Iodidimonas nitroreducens TaxID=1236968 RepID=UPI0012312FE5|nr:OmpA family protein [Iodidimonas nitroreducens]